jgi:hypothetical protein
MQYCGVCTTGLYLYFNQIKVNVDGVLFASEKRYGVGPVSRLQLEQLFSQKI